MAFRITPSDAFILVDGRVIGKAQEWSGQKGARTFSFPGAGSYLVKIRKPGMKDHRIAVEASGAGVTTPITVRLRSMAAAEVETSDLRTYQVREAVAFRAEPAGAVVSVDGQEMGSARQYSGGMGRKGWLAPLPGPAPGLGRPRRGSAGRTSSSTYRRGRERKGTDRGAPGAGRRGMRCRSRTRFATATVETLPRLTSIPGHLRVERMDNGLTVCLLENRQAPLVTSALFYRAGTRDESPGHGGVAHFLEHMMFKGSARFGPGEIDRRTQALGRLEQRLHEPRPHGLLLQLRLRPLDRGAHDRGGPHVRA